MNTRAANWPESGIQTLADAQIDDVNGGTLADIVDDVSRLVGAVLDAVSVTAPRDAASGLATGRRQHKPFVL
jgi:hypothetical protein